MKQPIDTVVSPAIISPTILLTFTSQTHTNTPSLIQWTLIHCKSYHSMIPCVECHFQQTVTSVVVHITSSSHLLIELCRYTNSRLLVAITAYDFGEGGPRTQESRGLNVLSDTEKLENLTALVAAQQMHDDLVKGLDAPGNEEVEEATSQASAEFFDADEDLNGDHDEDHDEDGQDIGTIMAEFPDGPLGTDDNKPAVVAQFFCEGEEIIFVSYPQLTLLRHKLIVTGHRGRLPIEDAITRCLPRIPNPFQTSCWFTSHAHRK